MFELLWIPGLVGLGGLGGWLAVFGIWYLVWFGLCFEAWWVSVDGLCLGVV